MHERLRPRCELLEDRAMPTILAVTTTLDEFEFGNNKQSLREAISIANDLDGPDVILLPAGVYRIAIDGAGENGNATGDFDVNGDVVIRGAGPALTIIDGQRTDRLFDLLDSFNVRFKGLTLQNGGDGSNRNVNGGAIQTLSAALTMEDCVVRRNFGRLGGAINNENGNVTLTRCTVARNSAGGSGGGIRVVTGTLAMTGSTVRRNLSVSVGGGVLAGSIEATDCTFADNASGNGGGGVFADTATLTRCRLSGNRAPSGGGLFAEQGALVAKCTISGNIASAGGGGIAFAESGTVTRSTISGNTAGGGSGGGGIVAVSATLESCTISGNVSLVDGGGISFLDGGSITSCTIADNTAAGVGGGVFIIPGAALPVEVRNSIIATNAAALGDFSGLFVDVSGEFTSRGSNLIGVGAGSFGFEDGVKLDQVGFFFDPIDPKLAPLADNGGPTMTHALRADSPAIDRGDSNVPQLIDQRGQPRKKDGNGDRSAIVDIGAFER